MKPKKCKDCKEIFEPFKLLQPRCVPCAIEKGKKDAKRQAEKARKQQQAKQRKTHKERKERVKTRPEWLREAQTAFNTYIRERDKNEPCISCQRYHAGQYHAGHYLSVGAMPELRFNELNCHKQCAPCNNHLSGNIALYRINLIKKIGMDRVEWLEGPHELQKLDIDQIKAIKQKYKEKLKALKETN